VEFGHGGIIHAVQMIARQDQRVFRGSRADFVDLLAHGIRGALVPFGMAHGLLGGPDLHPAGMEGVKLVGAGDVPVQADRVELRQHRDAVNARVDAVADWDVNQAVLAGHGYGRFGAHFGQWKQPAAAAASQDHCQNIIQRHCHFRLPS
jgi:hypothetical protein